MSPGRYLIIIHIFILHLDLFQLADQIARVKRPPNLSNSRTAAWLGASA
jgi:hypothetical protein